MQKLINQIVELVVKAEQQGVIPPAASVHICPDGCWISREHTRERVGDTHWVRLPPADYTVEFKNGQ